MQGQAKRIDKITYIAAGVFFVAALVVLVVVHSLGGFLLLLLAATVAAGIGVFCGTQST